MRNSPSSPPEFIRLNGHAIRVTSWTPLDDLGTFRLVTIVRGSADAALLADLLSQQPLDLEVPGEANRLVYPDCLERRDTGHPPATISRFSIDLSSTPSSGSTQTPAPAATAPTADNAAEPDVPASPSLEQRVTALETEVDRLKALIMAIANDPR